MSYLHHVDYKLDSGPKFPYQEKLSLLNQCVGGGLTRLGSLFAIYLEIRNILNRKF